MLEKLKELMKNVAPEVNLDNVTLETKLIDDLHFDSLGIMMFAMAIEDEFGALEIQATEMESKLFQNQKLHFLISIKNQFQHSANTTFRTRQILKISVRKLKIGLIKNVRHLNYWI